MLYDEKMNVTLQTLNLYCSSVKNKLSIFPCKEQSTYLAGYYYIHEIFRHGNGMVLSIMMYWGGVLPSLSRGNLARGGILSNKIFETNFPILQSLRVFFFFFFSGYIYKCTCVPTYNVMLCVGK